MPSIPLKEKERFWKPARKPFEGRKIDNMKFYNSKRWRTFRRMYLSRHPLCRHCEEKGIFTGAQHVDHITPINQGGKELDENNLQPLCLSCHNKKTASE